MKILVIGFPRSGTTLMYRIIKQHPEMKLMLFETNKMKNIGTQFEKQVDKIFPKGKNAGEKVIYEREIMGKLGSNSPSAVDYCKLWNNKFKEESIIIQIIRHPYDVWNSLLIKKYISRNKTNAIIKMQKKYFQYIPKYFERIAKFENCLTVKYEDLVLNSEVIIPKIYKHCGFEKINFSRNEQMRKGRVFSYKNKGFRIHDDRLINIKDDFMEVMKVNIEECLKVLNKFQGVKYEK